MQVHLFSRELLDFFHAIFLGSSKNFPVTIDEDVSWSSAIVALDSRCAGLWVEHGEPWMFCLDCPFEGVGNICVLADKDKFNERVVDDAFVVVFH